MEFPGNSHTAGIGDKEEDQRSTKAEPKKVIKGKAAQRKKSLGAQFKEMFVSDGGSFAEHLVENVVVPMVKDMALSIATQVDDGIRQGIEEMLFGGDSRGRGSRTSYGTGRPIVSYHARYGAGPNRYGAGGIRRDGNRPSPYQRVIRRSNVVQEIILESREDGDAILEELEAMIDGGVRHCTVGDLYSLAGIKPHSTDEEWGWTDLRRASVNKIGPKEFLLNMPRPDPIENGR